MVRMAFITVAMVLALSAPASAEWKYTHEKGGGSLGDRREALAKFINETCKPDDLGDITGFLSQVDDKSYDFHLFCYSGAGKLGPVLVKDYGRYSDGNDFLTNGVGGIKKFVVIGYTPHNTTPVVFYVVPQ